MPRKQLNPPRKNTKRHSWSYTDMEMAIKAVRQNVMGTNRAAKTFSVPRTTLQRLVSSWLPPEEAVKTKLGRKPIMPEELERELVKYLIVMEAKFYTNGLTRQDVRRLAFQLCEKNGIKHPFSDDGLAGRAWFDHFMNRNKNLLSTTSL